MSLQRQSSGTQDQGTASTSSQETTHKTDFHFGKIGFSASSTTSIETKKIGKSSLPTLKTGLLKNIPECGSSVDLGFTARKNEAESSPSLGPSLLYQALFSPESNNSVASQVGSPPESMLVASPETVATESPLDNLGVASPTSSASSTFSLVIDKHAEVSSIMEHDQQSVTSPSGSQKSIKFPTLDSFPSAEQQGPYHQLNTECFLAAVQEHPASQSKSAGGKMTAKSRYLKRFREQESASLTGKQKVQQTVFNYSRPIPQSKRSDSFDQASNGSSSSTEGLDKKQRYNKTADALKQSGLMEITMRTASLLQKNRALQSELVSLKKDTLLFLQSVLKNPENAKLRSQLTAGELNSMAQSVIGSLGSSASAVQSPTNMSFN